MNVWEKMLVALRDANNYTGVYSDTAQSIETQTVESKALSVLDKEVRDTAEALALAQTQLAHTIDQHKKVKKSVAMLDDAISEFEDYANQALKKKNETLALEIAEKIADMEKDVAEEHKKQRHIVREENELKQTVLIAEQNLKRLKQQVDTVKAAENLLRAQTIVAERSGTGEKLRTAQDSLLRIREKQIRKPEEMETDMDADITGVDSLKAKLKAAGIAPVDSKARDVLNRLRKK